MNKEEIKIENNTLIVKLNANATTGYTWNCQIENTQVLECVEEKYLPFANNGLVGVGGMYVAKFLSKTDGQTCVEFKYQRNWENQPIQTKTIIIKIENGQMTIVNLI